MPEADNAQRWEERRVEAQKALQECQQKLGLSSCLTCEQLLECSVRDGYVKAVYEAMSKGQGGGFEF